jgi:type II secretory pathway pseudopilin PulG
VRRKAEGFTYFAALFLVAVMGLAAAGAATSWRLSWQREKEQELLVAGQEIRTAIERYVIATPSGRRQYPRSLEDLVRDPRVPGVMRHLRRLQADPLTGREWGVVKAPDGGVMGVYSLAEGKPLKTGGFRVKEARFEGAASYRDWVFSYRDRYISADPPAKPR